ncbi:MAG: hypothetical protein AAGJ18_02950 [Bacteroidota bacterium]
MILLNLGDWWIALSGPQQAFWGIAIVSSILFVIQFVFSLIGLDADVDGDFEVSTDMDADPGFGMDADFTIFSVRSIIAFFTFFGWTGVLVLNAGKDVYTALGYSFLSGTLAMFIVGYLLYMFSRLSEDGNVEIEDAMFNTGKVYLTIPAKEGGQGKIHITIGNSFREVNAVTKSLEPLPTGSPIRVVDIIDDNLLLVEPIDALLE